MTILSADRRLGSGELGHPQVEQPDARLPKTAPMGRDNEQDSCCGETASRDEDSKLMPLDGPKSRPSLTPLATHRR